MHTGRIVSMALVLLCAVAAAVYLGGVNADLAIERRPSQWIWQTKSLKNIENGAFVNHVYSQGTTLD